MNSGSTPKGFEAPEKTLKLQTDARSPRPGKVFTFYSFKGGVGRSMALANIAVLVAARGNKVLVLDFDLEAPGLEHFFTGHDKTLNERICNAPGVIDLLNTDPIDWHQAVIPINLDIDKLRSLGGSDFNADRASLDIVHSGKASRVNDLYTQEVQGLDWPKLYQDADLGTRFGRYRAEWIAEYDYVFIDSRTGLTDIGDLCTVVLPDHLVMLFVTNQQNMDGVVSTYNRAVAEHAKIPLERAKLTVLPILSRDEFYSEYEKSGKWRSKAAHELSGLFSDWLPKDMSPLEAFQKIFIPYFAIWSFGEAIPVLDRSEELSNPSSISAAYLRIARLVLSDFDWKSLDAIGDPSEVEQTRLSYRADYEKEKLDLEAEISAERSRLAEQESKIDKRRRGQTFWIGIAATVAVTAGLATYSINSAKQLVAVNQTNSARAAEIARLEAENSQIQIFKIELRRRTEITHAQSVEIARLKAEKDNAEQTASKESIFNHNRTEKLEREVANLTTQLISLEKRNASDTSLRPEFNRSRKELSVLNRRLAALIAENTVCRNELRKPDAERVPNIDTPLQSTKFSIFYEGLLEENPSCAKSLFLLRSEVEKNARN